MGALNYCWCTPLFIGNFVIFRQHRLLITYKSITMRWAGGRMCSEYDDIQEWLRDTLVWPLYGCGAFVCTDIVPGNQ